MFTDVEEAFSLIKEREEEKYVFWELK